MNPVLKSLIFTLLNKRIIGAKHTPEKKLLLSKTKWLIPKDKRLFEKAYKDFIRKDYVLRVKKKTGKSGDWHISVNPRRLKGLYGEL